MISADGRRGAWAAADPEQVARGVPDAVAGAFLVTTVDEGDVGEQAVRLQALERGHEMRFFAATFGVAEAGDERLAVEHDAGVGGEHQIGLAGHGGDRVDDGAAVFEGNAQSG